MQGGVCYNRAVPLAMASLLQVEIIVPPDPGLMGAFGVALEVKQRLEMGVLEPGSFDLNVLARPRGCLRQDIHLSGHRGTLRSRLRHQHHQTQRQEFSVRRRLQQVLQPCRSPADRFPAASISWPGGKQALFASQPATSAGRCTLGRHQSLVSLQPAVSACTRISSARSAFESCCPTKSIRKG